MKLVDSKTFATHILDEIPVRRSSGVDDQCFKSICNYWKCLFKSRICVAKVLLSTSFMKGVVIIFPIIYEL
jgi:hypothetical protein